MNSKLSIIIVNYNVEYFLEQCLYSVYNAIKDIPTEIFVVDNNSVDGSVEMIKDKFPHVRLIENKKNTGFSFANNQAIKLSTGEYVLLLNPDTVVEEDTFLRTIQFMDKHQDAGALGVKMMDGKGNFLPESKRGLPTPSVAFYKIFGLSALFPTSKKFGKYHLGYLNKDEVHQVDILSGAFMLIRKSTLDIIGLLDETFFMYGEDIDLSYRILKANYKNYYFPETRIIHYKGESTKKSSVNYVFVFYNAMIIFAKKHFSQKNARFFSFLIQLAIYFRASVAVLIRIAKQLALPAFDFFVAFTGIYFIKNYYEHAVRFKEGGSYPTEYITYIIPIYIIIWLISLFFSGAYDKPIRLIRMVKGMVIGTSIILIAYALLPENLRFSRALILISSFYTLTSLVLSRTLFHLLGVNDFSLDTNKNMRVAIVGSEQECKRVESLLKQISVTFSFIGYISEKKEHLNKKYFIGSIDQLQDIIDIYKIDEVVFCAKNISTRLIMDQMAILGNTQVDYKIAPPESLSIIGSNSIHTSGDLYAIDINSISKKTNKRNKRILDIFIALVLLLTLPIHLLLLKSKAQFIKNVFHVLFGIKSWIGYSQNEVILSLPIIKKGVLNSTDAIKSTSINEETSQQLDLLYAKDYDAWNDLFILLSGYKKLGRKSS